MYNLNNEKLTEEKYNKVGALVKIIRLEYVQAETVFSVEDRCRNS